MQEEILEFWFGRPDTADYGSAREAWFRKDAAFDAAIGERFGAAIDTALSGGFADWTAARGTLARILLLDQFTRNSFRDTPRAFAGDALALSLAEKAIARGDDVQLIPVERWFIYLPYAHAESPSAQERAERGQKRKRDARADLKERQRHRQPFADRPDQRDGEQQPERDLDDIHRRALIVRRACARLTPPPSSS